MNLIFVKRRAWHPWPQVSFADLEIVAKLRRRCNALLNKVHACDEVVRLTDEIRCPQASTRLSRKYNCPVKSRLVSEQLAEIILRLNLPFSAKINVNVRGYTVEDEDMMCGDLMVNFSPRRSA